MAKQIREEPKIVAAAERQMFVRARAQEVEDRLERSRSTAKSLREGVKYIAISREAGAGGGEVGAAVGKRLGWPVYEKNLLDEVAAHFHVERDMLDLVDETPSNWVYDVLGTWMDRKIVPHEKFVAFLSRVLIDVSKHGPAVFVGRAAQFLLPRSSVLAVRIIASEKYRIQKLMERTGVKLAEARRSVRAIDEGRREFVARFFHRDIADPHCYDLVINVEHVGQQGVVEEILSALLTPALAAAAT